MDKEQRKEKIVKQILKEHYLDKSKAYVGQLITRNALYGTNFARFFIISEIQKIDNEVAMILAREMNADQKIVQIQANMHIDVNELETLIERECKENGLDISE